MIEPPANTQIWIAAGVTDLRRGFTGLSALVQTKLEKSPMSGQVFIFRGRRGDLVKLIWFDGDGLCLFCKRLKRGRFVWPQASEGVVHLTRAQLSMLLEGIDWHRPEPTCADVGVDAGCGFPLFFLRTRNPVRGILRVMLVPTLPDLSTLDRERLQAMLVAEHQEHIATHARLQSRESEIEHRKLLLSQLRRMQFGRKSEKLERQIGTAAGRSATESALRERPGERRSAAIGDGVHRDGYSSETGTRCVASTSAADDADASTKTDDLSRLWRRVTEIRRRHLRDTGLPAGELRGDSLCAAEAELRALRANRAGAGTKSADCSWSGWPWAAGTYAGQQGCPGRDQSQHGLGQGNVSEGGAVAQDYDLAGVSVYWCLCLQSKYCFCSSLLRTLKSLWS
jgi:transposase